MEDTPIARLLKSGDRFFRGVNVRLLSPENEQLGIVSFEAAIAKAKDYGLDLVEMNGHSTPPVCRIMDFGKWQYQEDKKAREAKKNSVQQKIKEVKFHLHIDDNDFNTKMRHAVEFLQRGDKVKVLLTYRGREMSHQDLGQQLMEKIIQTAGEAAVVDSPAKLLGKNYQVILAPNKQKKKKAPSAPAEQPAPEKAPEAKAP